jgi:cytochrome c-type biogenesis protein CcmH/NrfG
MKRSTIILILLIVLAILAYNRTGVWRAPGATTQTEQRRIKGMSVIVTDL